MLHHLATWKPRSSIIGTIEVQLLLQTLGIRSSKSDDIEVRVYVKPRTSIQKFRIVIN